VAAAAGATRENTHVASHQLPPNGTAAIIRATAVVIHPRRVALLTRKLVNHFPATKNAFWQEVARRPLRHAFAYLDHAFGECSSRAMVRLAQQIHSLLGVFLVSRKPYRAAGGTL
jgi:hypothetical protein